jgi:hypothetical protein
MSNATANTFEPKDGGRREKRAEWVRPASGQLPDLTLRFATGPDIPVGTLRNVSNSGASLLIGRPLTPGTKASVVLTVQKATMAYVARVVWCRMADGGDFPLMGPDADASADDLYAVGLHLLGPGSFATMIDFAAHAHQEPRAASH